MKVLDAFSDQMSSHAAVAVEAAADASGVVGALSASWNSVGAPSEGAVSDPSLLAVSWSNPDARLLAAVNDEKRPLGFEFGYVAVGNGLGLDWVDNDEIVVAQDQLGANPEQGCCGGDCACKGDVEQQNAVSGRVEHSLSQVKSDESKSDVTPDEVAFWAINVDVLHKPIIAGVPAGGEGK